MRFAAVALAVLTITLGAAAQPLRFGADVPLTNTRYGTTAGFPKFVTAGNDLYAFWASGNQLRMTKVKEGERRGGVAVLTLSRMYVFGAIGSSDRRHFDAVWTGAHFIVAAETNERQVVTRAIAANGEPLTPPMLIANAFAPEPVLAWNGRTALMLYSGSNGIDPEIRALPLTPLGGPVQGAGEVVFNGTFKALATNGSGFGAIVARTNEAWLVTFDANGRMRTWISVGSLETFDRSLAIASDGSDYLAVFHSKSELGAIPLSAGGSPGRRITIDRETPADPAYGFQWPAVAWTGDGWMVTYSESRVTGASFERKLHIAQLDQSAIPLSLETMPGLTTQSIAVVNGRVATAWWTEDAIDAPLFSFLPLTGNAAIELTHAAAEQRLRATTSSKSGILVIWEEFTNGDRTLHAGIRMHTGDWAERTLDFWASPILAASDGTNFLLIAGTNAYRFDERLTQIGAAVKLPIAPSAVASNGSVYAMVEGAKGALLTTSGTVTPAITLSAARLRVNPSIASDGQNFLVVWEVNVECAAPICVEASGVVAVRFDSGMKRLDANDLVFETNGNLRPYAAWNGQRYDVLWDGAGIMHLTIPPSGAVPEPKTIAQSGAIEFLGAVGLREGTALLIRQYSANLDQVTRVIAVDRSGLVRQSDAIDHGATNLTATPRLVVLADGRLAYLASREVVTAPQHGSSHVMLAIDGATSPPAAPQLTATAEGRNVRLSWTAVAGATGYRVEYKINDGSWNELDRWFGTTDRITTIRLNRAEDKAAFRVRAWGDGGTGSYSMAAVVNPGRRRAVH